MPENLSIGDCVLVQITPKHRKSNIQHNEDETSSKQGIGLIRYIGMIHDHRSSMRQYIGMELLQPIQNGHDGNINGRKYFSVPMGHGIHIPIHQIVRKLSVAELFKKLKDITFLYLKSISISTNKKDENTNNSNIPLYLQIRSKDSVDSAYIFSHKRSQSHSYNYPKRSRNTTISAPQTPHKHRFTSISSRKTTAITEITESSTFATHTQYPVDDESKKNDDAFKEESSSEYSDSDSDSSITSSSDLGPSNFVRNTFLHVNSLQNRPAAMHPKVYSRSIPILNNFSDNEDVQRDIDDSMCVHKHNSDDIETSMTNPHFAMPLSLSAVSRIRGRSVPLQNSMNGYVNNTAYCNYNPPQLQMRNNLRLMPSNSADGNIYKRKTLPPMLTLVQSKSETIPDVIDPSIETQKAKSLRPRKRRKMVAHKYRSRNTGKGKTQSKRVKKKTNPWFRK